MATETQANYPVDRPFAHLTLAHLRVALAQERAKLRQQQDQVRLVRAAAEQATIEAAGGDKALGSNAESRERALTLALVDDEGYQSALGSLRATEAYVAALEAELEIRLDERRERELAVRDRLAEALLALASTRVSQAADQVAEQELAAGAEERA